MRRRIRPFEDRDTEAVVDFSLRAWAPVFASLERVLGSEIFNSRPAKADLVEEVQRLKAESDAPLRTIGSLSVVKALLEARMVDRLRLTVFPLILGSTGREPVFAGLPDIHLELVDTEVLDARLVTLEYRPDTAQQAN
jgi:dihydrofolate reductase